MMRTHFMLVLGTALGLLVATACGRETVVAARRHSQPDASLDDADAGQQQPGQRCTASPDCLRDEYCDKPSCAASEGTCRARPSACDSELAPVCDCAGR